MRTPIKPIKKSRVSEEVLKQLQELILNGTYRPGDQLPSERDLSLQFQVSRASIREALRILENMGFLESQVGVGGGNFVREFSIDSIINPFSEFLNAEKKMLLEILEYRLVLETEIARIAAKRRTDEDIQRIGKVLKQMEREIEEGGIGLQGDSDFHESVAMATHNEIFVKMSTLAKTLLNKTRETTLMMAGQPLLSLADHQHIYEAIKLGDPLAAAETMKDHLTKARRNVLSGGTVE
jgi:GntR family transcriptional repressor for pyruvate dehydrogenase complex